MTANTGRRTGGTQTTARPVCSPARAASATCSGVLANGAGFMPAVIRPTKPTKSKPKMDPLPDKTEASE